MDNEDMKSSNNPVSMIILQGGVVSPSSGTSIVFTFLEDADSGGGGREIIFSAMISGITMGMFPCSSSLLSLLLLSLLLHFSVVWLPKNFLFRARLGLFHLPYFPPVLGTDFSMSVSISINII